MAATVSDDFLRSIDTLLARVYIEHGIRGDVADDCRSIVFSSKRRNRTVALSWDSYTRPGEISWHLDYSQDGTTSHGYDSVFPAEDPGSRTVGLISRLAQKSPSRTVDTKGKLAVIVFGWTMLVGTLALLKLLAVSTPGGAWTADDFPWAPLLSNAQQIANALTLGDLPLIIIGSFLNSPLPGLIVLFGIGMLFILHALPRITLSDDVLSWRAGAIYLFTMLAGFGTIALAPAPWNIVSWVVLIYFGFAVFKNYSVPWQLERWARFSRIVLISRFADRPSALAENPPDRVVTLGEVADELHTLALKLRKTALKKRDHALNSDSWNDGYFIARLTKIGLAADFRAAKRSRPANSRALGRRHVADVVWFRTQQWSLFRGIPLLTAVALAIVVLSPTPWIAPVCATSAGDARTVFVLPSGNPTFVDDTTRDVTALTSWDGYTFTPGSC